ncbi:MAG: hypothetical protein CR217_12485 [Beijerinckiaceae bacterium]|nr:MAG: hypothetical protein CR217_12485 [Beijerinckiaceae bacterium]
MDQFPADGAEENNLFCNPAPNGDKRRADLRPISITNPPASLAPPFGFLAKDAELSLQCPQSP